MKKILSLGLLLTIAVIATAQHDTLPYYIGMPQFYMDHPLYGALDDTNHNGTSCSSIFSNSYTIAGRNTPNIIDGDLAIGFYPDSTLHIIGVAMPYVSNGPSIGSDFKTNLENFYSLLNDTYMTHFFDSIVFRLYQPNGGHMSLLKTATIDSTFDTANCRIYMMFAGINDWYILNFHNVNVRAVMMEVFFDSEVDVSDSFYVSSKQLLGDHYSMDYTPIWKEWHSDAVDTFRFPRQSYRVIENSTNPDDLWHYGEGNFYPLIWPLIRRDSDTCPTVQGLNYIKSSVTKAIFRWQRGEGHRDWQLSYGPVGTAPEDGTIIDYNQTHSGLIEFDPDSHYVVYVRARCRFARFEYGPWSAPLHFCLNGNGLEEASATELTLSPNPAADMVTVGCSAGMTQITVFNAAGVQVHTEAMGGGTSATIDTKGWPAGQYVVSVETAAGTASKVLTVAR